MTVPSTYNGLVIVDKPAGMTSHDVVAVARKLYRTKRVGHTGTLDPDATGVLVLCLGQATRIAEYLSASRKHYVADIVFGRETDTQDASGQVVREQDAADLTREQVEAALPPFRGAIQQIPPMVSAIHHEGKRLYELARQGVEVERTARDVMIDELLLTDFQPGPHPIARLEITCSTGTYIRTLAFDIGTALEVGATMQTLRRTWVGARNRFALADAHTLDDLRQRADADDLAATIFPLSRAVQGWPQVRLSAEQTARLRNGQTVDVWHDDAPAPVIALTEADDVCAIATIQEGRLRPVKVFAHAGD